MDLAIANRDSSDIAILFNQFPFEANAPLLTCPGPVILPCLGPDGAVANFTATASDDCDPQPVVSYDRPSGSRFPPGTTLVTATAVDAAGNQSQCTFDVQVVVDETRPLLTCPGPLSVQCTGPDGAVGNFSATATDACDPQPVVSYDHPPGSKFPPGTTLVTVTATDAVGNESRCTFEIQVLCGIQFPGDCNQDGDVDVSDAVCALGYLFMGDPVALPCGTGASGDPGNRGLLDWNDDQDIDLSDAVALLSWLFQGGGAHALGSTCLPIAGCPSACRAGR